MGLFGSRQKKSRALMLVCHFGSARVAAALVLTSGSTPARVLYSTAEEIPFQKEHDYSRFTTGMLSGFETVLARIEREGLPHIHTSRQKKQIPIDRVVCIYSAPWHMTHTQTLLQKTKEGRSVKVTQTLIDNLVAQEAQRFSKQGLPQYTKEVGAAMDIIEQQVTGITLDGYTVGQPIGRETHELSFTLMLTMIPAALRSAVADALSRRLHSDNIVHHSFSYASFIGVRDTLEHDGYFLLVDVTGEISELSLTQDTLLLHTASFPYGTRSIVRDIAQQRDVRLDVARSLVHTALQKAGGSEINVLLENAVHTWAMQFVETVEAARAAVVVPKTVFCISDMAYKPLFERALQDALTQLGMASNKTAVRLLDAGMLQRFVTFRSGLTPNIFIAFAALFGSRLHTLAEG